MTDRQHEPDFFSLLATIFRVIRNRRLILILSIVAASVVGILIALLSAPVYRSSVLMAVADDSGSGSLISSELAGVASLVGIGAGAASRTEEAIALLSSRRLTAVFFEQNKILSKLFKEKWNADKNTWKDAEDAPTLIEALDYFDTKVRSVSRDFRSDLITITIDWSNPVEAADWANALVELANNMQREAAIRDASKQMAYIEEQLTETNEIASRAVLYRIMEEQMTQIAVANTREEFAFRVIDPAVPADVDRPLKPRPVLLTVTAGFFGLFAGFLIIFVLEIRSRIR